MRGMAVEGPTPGSVRGAIFSLFLCFLAGGSGCMSEEVFPCEREPPLTYQTFGQGYLEKNCTGCHSSLLNEAERNGAPPEVNLDTYADVVAWAERIRKRAVIDRSMPPGGGPSEEETQRLNEWLLCQVYADQEAIEAAGSVWQSGPEVSVAAGRKGTRR